MYCTGERVNRWLHMRRFGLCTLCVIWGNVNEWMVKCVSCVVSVNIFLKKKITYVFWTWNCVMLQGCEFWLLAGLCAVQLEIHCWICGYTVPNVQLTARLFIIYGSWIEVNLQWFLCLFWCVYIYVIYWCPGGRYLLYIRCSDVTKFDLSVATICWASLYVL